MDEYKDIRNLLKPRRSIKASEIFRNTIENDLQRKSYTGHGWRILWGGLTVGAAAAILILLAVPSGMSAKEILTEAISAIKQSGNIEMKVEIRTESMEIFDHINPKAEFVSHDIIVQRNDSAIYWYVDKGERTAEKNSNGLYVWISPYKIGWHYPEHDYDVLGYLNVLMNPENVLESELQSAMSESGARHEIAKRNGEFVLTVHSMPDGDFTNPYVLNTSVKESENIRRYVLDAKNYHLKSSTVAIVIDGKEIEILRVTDVDYYPEPKSLPSPPADITFIEETETSPPSGIPGLDARETACVFMKAFSNWDTDILYKYLNPVEAEDIYRQTYEGANLLTLGVPFRSGGNSHLVFVPYTLRLKGGNIKKMNLVLSRYSEEAWCFDGGL